MQPDDQETHSPSFKPVNPHQAKVEIERPILYEASCNARGRYTSMRHSMNAAKPKDLLSNTQLSLITDTSY
jgi:hypothetical protein